MGLQRMTKEHLGIALALNVPVFVVVTKVDICPKGRLEETLTEINKVLKSPGARKMPFSVRSDEDAVAAAAGIVNERITPIFQVSNVTGLGHNHLTKFLKMLSVRNEWGSASTDPPEFSIDDAFRITGVGTVVAGTVIAGTIEANSTMLFGPDNLGKFKPVTLKSIHSKYTQMKSVCAGMSASFNIKSNVKRDVVTKQQVRKGMVLVHPSLDPVGSTMFDAEVQILHHPTTMTVNYQPVVHCGIIRQSARILKIVHTGSANSKAGSGKSNRSKAAQDANSGTSGAGNNYLRTGDKATVTFQFMYRPEFLREGTKLIFREGRTKGIGKVTHIHSHEAAALLAEAPS